MSAVRNSQNSRFIEEQDVGGLLSQLGIRTSFIKMPLLGDMLFQVYGNEQ